MPIEFRCGQCSQLLRVPEDSAGKQARCPRCQALMPVPPTELNAANGPAPNPVEVPAKGEIPFGAAPFAESPSPKPTSDNPFGEAVGENPFSRPAAGNLNPYASPATFASYQPTTDAAGQRLGLPWDNGPRTFGCWFHTIRVILGSPSEAFAMMHQTGGLGPPIRYTVYGVGMPLAAVLMLVAPIVAIALMVERNAGNQAETIGIVVGAALGIVLFAIVYVLLFATIGNLFTAGIWHLFLMMVGGAKAPYETTFRVTSYVNGSLTWLSFIPYVGGCAAGIWTIVLLIIGLAKAHEIPTSKAVIAVLIPIGICGFAYLALIAVGISLAVFGEAR